jgi:hypothetical protein
MRADPFGQDGSPAGFVLLAMENAQLPRPQQSWGLVVFEQEAASVLKRHDEVSAGPHIGSIARSVAWSALLNTLAPPRRHRRIPRRQAQGQERTAIVYPASRLGRGPAGRRGNRV